MCRKVLTLLQVHIQMCRIVLTLLRVSVQIYTQIASQPKFFGNEVDIFGFYGPTYVLCISKLYNRAKITKQ